MTLTPAVTIFSLLVFLIVLLIARTGDKEYYRVCSGKHAYVFWTGGYDSTFLILKRLSLGYYVQPVYIIDRNVDGCRGRQNRAEEIRAQIAIRRAIHNRWPYRLFPTIYVDALKIDRDIADACKKIHADGYFTRDMNQYGYMAQCTRALGTIIETGSEKGAESVLSKVVEGKLNSQWLLRADAQPAHLHVFDRVRFPLNQTTKEDMLAMARAGGYDDILHLTTSCWYPRNGKPCARCHMCRERII